MTITLNSLTSRQLDSVLLNYFSGVLSCLCVWNIFFSLFILLVLGRSVTTHDLEEVALFRKCPMEPSGGIPLSPEPGAPEVFPG